MSAALMPWVRSQFFDANGAPLAGGFVYTYAAGTTTPQAAYTDSSGNTPLANPIVLDAAGTASIWLGTSAYKLVIQDANAVTIETIDNVSSVSQSQLQGTNSFSSLTVSGDESVGGNLTVSGSITAASESITGALSVGGTATLQTASVTGNESVGGTLDVTGETTLGTLSAGSTTVSDLTIGSTSLTDFVTALIPTLSALAGTLVISGVATSGSWVIFTFGTTSGTRVRIAFGAGTLSHGSSITLPSGFSAANSMFQVSINNVNSTPDNNLDGFTASLSGLTIVATGNDNSGHTFNGTANWFGITWQQSY